MRENPEGIGSVKASYEAVCVGAVNRGEWNNCAAEALYVVTTVNGEHLMALGACDRHILGVKKWMADRSTGEALLVTSPEGLYDVLSRECIEKNGGMCTPIPMTG